MMEQLGKDPWFIAFGFFQLFASLAALGLVVGRWRRDGVLLRYEPRQPVPWGGAGALLAVAFTALTLVSAFSIEDTPQPLDKPSPQGLILSLAASMVMQSLGPILLLFIIGTSKARWSDIGLPSRSRAAWMRDIGIGVVACLAAIVPVGLVNAAARSMLNFPNELTKHPLVEMLTNNEPEIVVLVVATIMAVIAAPIGEEITFRLLLQGWLEKWEDHRLGWRMAPPADVAGSNALATEGNSDVPPEFAGEQPVEMVPLETAPPQRGLAGLPYGWAPIILSSFLFAVAHYGYGPEPIPLFVLALFLGYCYQRTHRILPCIIAHSLFNLFSMIALWRIVLITAD